jgi:hypothetical protein
MTIFKERLNEAVLTELKENAGFFTWLYDAKAILINKESLHSKLLGVLWFSGATPLG